MTYAILGANGAVGQELVPVLAGRGKALRVVGRSIEKSKKLFSRYEPQVQYAQADLADPEQAARVCEGVDTLFYLVGVPYTDFGQHPKLSRIVLDAAKRASVRRLVHLSTVYPYGVPRTAVVDESHPREPVTFKGRMRKEQEDLVLAAHDSGGMRTVLVRPPDFYGPTSEQSYVYSMFKAAREGTRADVIGPIDAPHEFIFVPDLARTLAELAELEEAYGQAWNLGGPGTISTRRFAELVFAQAGREPNLRVATKFLLRVMGLFNPFLREVLEMHYLWTNPVILDDRRIHALLPGLRKTSYEEGIRLTYQAMFSASTRPS
jgi:nucleoside-diphosphate-sugar epimerase